MAIAPPHSSGPESVQARLGRLPGKAAGTGAGMEGPSSSGPSAGSGAGNNLESGTGDDNGGLTPGLKGETSEGLPGTTICVGGSGNGSTAESIGKGAERGTRGSASSPPTGLPGSQIEQGSAQVLPNDFSAFLAEQRVSKLESHFTARATASWTVARQGRIRARDSAAS